MSSARIVTKSRRPGTALAQTVPNKSLLHDRGLTSAVNAQLGLFVDIREILWKRFYLENHVGAFATETLRHSP